MVMHRNKHSSIPRRESQVNASWPAFHEGARLGAGLRSAAQRWRSKVYNRQQRSLEVKQKLLARVQINELLKSLRTDRFVGQVHPVSHAIYIQSPERRIPDKTSESDATSVSSSLSGSFWLGHPHHHHTEKRGIHF